MFSQHTKSQHNQAETKEMTQKTTGQPSANQDPQAKGKQAAAVHLILPAHKKTPPHKSMRGCYND